MNKNRLNKPFSIMKKAIIYQLLVFMVGGFLLLPGSQVLAVEALSIQATTVNVSGTTATITWRTNQAASGWVDYGTSSGSYHYRLSTNQKKIDQAITLFGLEADRTYFFKITAVADLSEVVSFERSFKTEEYSDHKAPIISGVTVPYVSATTATIQWNTDEPATTEVEYGITQSYGSSRGDGNLVRVHDITIKGLNPSTHYQFLVKSKDKDNSVARWYNLSFRTADSLNIENQELTIYDVRPSSENDVLVGQDSAVISWRTNKLAEGKIRYSTSPNPGKVVDVNPPRDFSREVTLTGLVPGTTYYYEVEAKDVFGRSVKSQGHSFRTKGTGNVLPVNSSILGASTEGLIVYLPFDEGSGSVAHDESFSGNDGRLDPSMPPSWTKGNYGNALDFSRDGQNVAISDNADLSLRGGVTMLAWINIRNYGPYDKIISKEKAYELLLGSGNGVLRMAVYPEGANDWKWLNSPTAPLNKDAWQLVAGTFDGQTMRLYVNGNQVAETNYGLIINDSAHPIYIGGNVVNKKEWFDGLIDDAAVFNYALSPSEMQTIYNLGVARYLAGAGIPTQSGSYGTGGNDNVNDNTQGQVLGVSNFSSPAPIYACNPDLGYTKIKALYKTADSPDVWAILETGQKHYITSPASFNAYQCDWNLIKTVSKSTLNSHPTARLVRTLNNSTIYHLYQRPQTKWLKLAISSPTVFISYPENFWGNVARITDIDVANYPAAKLIKTADNPNVYLLEGSAKRLIPSEAVFDQKQFEWFEIVTINQIHAESYQTGPVLQ